MADLMRMLENYSRQAKQQEDKINLIKLQEESLLKDLETAHSVNNDKKRVLAEIQARCGDVLSDLQQKRTTLVESQAANQHTKELFSQTQDQREQSRQQLQQMREEFIATCAALENKVCNTLGQLRACIAAGLVVNTAELAAVGLGSIVQHHIEGDLEAT